MHNEDGGIGEESSEPTGNEEMPDTAELEEPSTEKDPGEEPDAPTDANPDADHEAIGIGVVGRPQVDPDAVN